MKSTLEMSREELMQEVTDWRAKDAKKPVTRCYSAKFASSSMTTALRSW